MLKKLTGVLGKGYQIASGTSPITPYKDGSISLQKPFFEERGFCMEGLYLATLNIDISKHEFTIIKPDYVFENLQWEKDFPAETFSIVSCTLIYKQMQYDAFIYYPHVETKTKHLQNKSTLEILAPFVDGISYGDSIELKIDTRKVYINFSDR